MKVSKAYVTADVLLITTYSFLAVFTPHRIRLFFHVVVILLSVILLSIPDKVKFALVTPIHKGNEKDKFENYRPISVLNCFSKLLEKFVAGRLTKFIDMNDILSKHQYGFRKNRSAGLATHDFTDRITKAVDERKFTVGIFLIYQKRLIYN